MNKSFEKKSPICRDCYQRTACDKKKGNVERCDDYLKDSKIGLTDNVDVNPMDTLQFDYDDIKKLVDSDKNR